ncbi:MAG TPA: GSCFA domain-containing protein, partial [Candidatus Elarobacter sp.]|nr:GSCFA domain-containing protein [Candidatus Elarobacter sp.]
MKVYVVGNCQAPAIALCLSRMNPGITAEAYEIDVDATKLAAPGDVIFRQRVPWETFTKRELAPNEIMFPQIWFNGFHPDSVYVAEGNTFIDSPLGQYHSSLAFWGWQHGLSVERTLELFTGPVFEHLNFFRFWNAARHAQLAEANDAGFPFDALLARWRQLGCFMHSVNHPKLVAIADLSRALAARAGIEVVVERPEDYLEDPLLRSSVWPIYPEIGKHLGIPGAYAFKPPGPSLETQPMGLRDFVAASFATYASRPGPLTCERLHNEAFRGLERFLDAQRRPSIVKPSPAPVRAGGSSPYVGLPREQFWRQAVANVAPGDVDPVGDPPFAIGTTDRVATAGSCFAQNVSRALDRDGFNYYVTERAPAGMDPQRAVEANYGTYSARYGNVYTAGQLLQLFDRAYGTFAPYDTVWTRPDGRFADPFRPQIDPDGFASPDDVLRAREEHFAAVRTMFESLDVFVFTLGLTETWRSKRDGAVFPTAPGVAAGAMDPDAYEFHNVTVAEVVDDL